MSVDIRPTPPAQDSARQNVTLQIVSVVMFTFIGYLTIGIRWRCCPATCTTTSATARCWPAW